MAVDTNAIEVTWTLVALIGVGIHVRGVLAALADRRAVLTLSAGDVVLRMLATGRLRGEAIRVVVDAAFAGIGVYVMFQPDPPSVTLAGYLFAGVFIGAVALLVTNGLLDDRERVLLREHIARTG